MSLKTRVQIPLVDDEPPLVGARFGDKESSRNPRRLGNLDVATGLEFFNFVLHGLLSETNVSYRMVSDRFAPVLEFQMAITMGSTLIRMLADDISILFSELSTVSLNSSRFF